MKFPWSRCRLASLASELKQSLAVTHQAIGEARCLQLKHEHNAAFYASKIAFLERNAADAHALISKLSPPKDPHGH